jgi:hypothetical protein
LGYVLEFTLINEAELSRMYAIDGTTLAAARSRYFSGLTAITSIFLTPVILAATVSAGLLLSAGRPRVRAWMTVLCSTVPAALGASLISQAYADQQVGGIWWGSAFLSGPLVHSLLLLAGERIKFVEHELA